MGHTPKGEVMEFHRVAALFPLMAEEEVRELAADIRANGLREPIWVYGGQIIDGRNRYRACLEAGIDPDYRHWDGAGSLVAFVVSLNLHRRHLTASQRGCVGAEMLPMLEEEAAERKASTQFKAAIPDSEPLFGDVETDPIIVSGPEPLGESREIAAKAVGVGASYVSDAKRIATEAPEVFAQVKSGEMTIPQAKRELAKRNVEIPAPIEGMYRIFYADPPWSYGNSGVIGDSDNYGHVARHYPSMSIEELCLMGVHIRASSETDAVLFMWVTSPLLEDAFAVIRAWGFKYKTSFVWDKVRHNFGHYNSVRHELLLVCTKGSCTPDIPELIPSVQTIERSTTHSEKPEKFRAIIDALYTHGNRIELFARKATEGWDRWGNQSDLALSTSQS